MTDQPLAPDSRPSPSTAAETVVRVDVLTPNLRRIDESSASASTALTGTWTFPARYAGATALLYRTLEHAEHVRIPSEIGSALDCTEATAEAGGESA